MQKYRFLSIICITIETNSSSPLPPPRAKARSFPCRNPRSVQPPTFFAFLSVRHRGRYTGQHNGCGNTSVYCRVKGARRSPMPCRWNRQCTPSVPLHGGNRPPLSCRPSAKRCRAKETTSSMCLPSSLSSIPKRNRLCLSIHKVMLS